MKNLSIFLFALTMMSSQAQQTVSYNDENQKLEGIVAVPEKKTANGNAVLILPAWMGIDNNAKENATELAKLGYLTFVADIYGVDKRPTNPSEAGKLAGYYKTNIKEYQKRIQLALNELIKQGANPDKIAVIGYCFGGTGAIEVARTNMNVRGVVSFHGGLGRDASRTIEPIKLKF
ncbi:MAG: dienelactone hydrolase family protein [Flavobacterium sp.]